MARIFISYRRDDSAGYVGRLRDRLLKEFGPSEVFRDIDGIKPGEDFRISINQTLAKATVLLAIIGRRWVGVMNAAGQRRLDQQDDLVRLEIQTALERGVLVIPVLVDGARMPSAEELPDGLRGLASKHALELADVRWDHDIELLISSLRPRVGKASPPPWRSRVLVVAAAAAVLLVAGLPMLWRGRSEPVQVGGVWSGTLAFVQNIPIRMEFFDDSSVRLRSAKGDVAFGRWLSRAGSQIHIDARHRDLGAFTCQLAVSGSSLQGPCEAAGRPAGVINLSNRQELDNVFPENTRDLNGTKAERRSFTESSPPNPRSESETRQRWESFLKSVRK